MCPKIWDAPCHVVHRCWSRLGLLLALCLLLLLVASMVRRQCCGARRASASAQGTGRWEGSAGAPRQGDVAQGPAAAGRWRFAPPGPQPAPPPPPGWVAYPPPPVTQGGERGWAGRPRAPPPLPPAASGGGGTRGGGDWSPARMLHKPPKHWGDGRA
jgi:hypothetical protein